MTYNISQDVFEKISSFVQTRFGLYFSEKRFNDLIRGVINAAKQKNIDFEEYIDLILLNKLSQEDIKQLTACLTIGETYFFRDKKLFEILRQKILPDMIHAKKCTDKKLKIWSAGCSSGEEAYSVAILIKELIPDYKDWDIKIIATDINHSSLSKARKGIYREWSFRGVDLNIKNKYFKKINDMCYKLDDEIMELVTFHHLNLADPMYVLDHMIMNHIDIIFCRNVLMYFSKYHVSQIINRFYNMIVNGGWFVVAPSESLFLNGTFFTPINVNGMFLYNKNMKQNNFMESFSENIIQKELFIQNEVKIYPKNEYKNMSIESLITPIEDRSSKKEGLQEKKVDVGDFEKLSRSFANEGKLEEAIQWCKKAIAIDKINPLYYYLLASIQQEQGNMDEAIGSLKKAIYLDSDFIMAYFDLGNLYLKKEKYKEAFKNFDNACILLNHFNEEEIIPHSEEMSAGVLKELIQSLYSKGD
ncbi:CheR family methyltransferase [Crassaminicella profunda]|uniref:CheR family methyltransferase n=1 Tax=Crassaminicella profunda TaxID=1286698 RepID=UPI001CA63168|nr:protein-glutamate O-methyltransferase CheR [Crassaminicella profunda]QZY57300.1 tetratricopeptide repeat protein [Crassaminicella profunda]